MSKAGSSPSVSTLIFRALRLRCPNCGGSGVFRSFLDFKDHCPTCGMRLHRGESDYFVGAYMLNLIAVELLVMFAVAVYVIWRWPNPPWEAITWVSIVLMLAGSLLCLPFAKTSYLAMDLAMRPMSPEEMDWHREKGELGDRELPQL